ncbi:MAG: Hsp33 family molecular chaperone HslO [Pseudomonadota bacterium]
MTGTDSLHRFVFEVGGARGELVQLDAAWRAVLDTHAYPAVVAEQLGEALAAASLLSASIKLAGSLVLQIQGEGPLHLLVAQATARRTLRGLAHWRADVNQGDLGTVFGSGRLAITIDVEGAERYQGIVALQGENLAAALDGYFAQSEQLPTRLWLAANRQRAAGLLLQRLPGGAFATDDWERVVLLADTVSRKELLGLPRESLLQRLFREDDIRLFSPEPMAFRCGCTRERMRLLLKTLGAGEVREILSEQGEVKAHCEYCNREYRFDQVDVAAIFAAALPTPSRTQH